MLPIPSVHARLDGGTQGSLPGAGRRCWGSAGPEAGVVRVGVIHPLHLVSAAVPTLSQPVEARLRGRWCFLHMHGRGARVAGRLCGGVRFMPRLAVFTLLCAVLVSTPVAAQHLRFGRIQVYTRNLYIGTDFGPCLPPCRTRAARCRGGGGGGVGGDGARRLPAACRGAGHGDRGD